MEYIQLTDFPTYEINRAGIVRNIKTKRPLKQELRDGYYKVNLFKDGKNYIRSVHRLLGLTFIPNPDNLPLIDHIDRDKTNNHLDNLRWATVKTNVNNSNGIGSKPCAIRCIETGIIYKSISEASKATQIHRTNINRSVKNNDLRAGGYHWQYIEGDDDL